MLILMAQGVGNPCATHKCCKQEQLNNDENRGNQMILEARLVETKKNTTPEPNDKFYLQEQGIQVSLEDGEKQ